MTFLVDANVLIYAYDGEARHHEAAGAWLAEQLNGLPQSVALPWPSVLAFVRVLSHPSIYPRPADPEALWGIVEQWLERPSVWVPLPGPRHRLILGKLVREVPAGGNLVMDAHLAALAAEHGLTVASADSDFAKFGTPWVNPVALPEQRGR